MPQENLGDPIPRTEPYIVPASPEQEFDSIWLRSINIFAPQINHFSTSLCYPCNLLLFLITNKCFWKKRSNH